MAEVDTTLMQDFEIMVILKTANKTSNSVTLSKVCELDAIIWAGINLYNDPITEIEVTAVWNISEHYKKEDKIYLADNWVYLPLQRKFYRREVKE